MIILGGLLGLVVGGFLAGGLIAVSGLPVYGPASAVVVAILTNLLGGILTSVVSPMVTLFAAGLALLVATIFVYAGAAISLLGVATPPSPAGELFCRGIAIGMASSVNFLVMSAIPRLAPLAGTAFVITLLALIPPIAASRFIYQPILGLMGWILPLNWLMLPLGILLFLVAAPFAIAAGGIGAIRFDSLTMTIETSGGAVLALAPAAFNIGNFTFIPPATAPTGFAAAGISAHETGHTLTNAAFGGFIYWIGAVDENVPPLRRGAFAYTEMLADSHFGGVGGPSVTMW